MWEVREIFLAECVTTAVVCVWHTGSQTTLWTHILLLEGDCGVYSYLMKGSNEITVNNFFSCRDGHLRIVQLLIENYNYNTSITNRYGDTALYYACKYVLECHHRWPKGEPSVHSVHINISKLWKFVASFPGSSLAIQLRDGKSTETRLWISAYLSSSIA